MWNKLGNVFLQPSEKLNVLMNIHRVFNGVIETLKQLVFNIRNIGLHVLIDCFQGWKWRRA